MFQVQTYLLYNWSVFSMKWVFLYQSVQWQRHDDPVREDKTNLNRGAVSFFSSPFIACCSSVRIRDALFIPEGIQMLQLPLYTKLLHTPYKLSILIQSLPCTAQSTCAPWATPQTTAGSHILCVPSLHTAPNAVMTKMKRSRFFFF